MDNINEKNAQLCEARARRGLTQAELAEGLAVFARGMNVRGDIRVNASMISKWERGLKRPHKTYRRLLCGFLRASEEQLGLKMPSIDGAFELRTPGITPGVLFGSRALSATNPVVTLPDLWNESNEVADPSFVPQAGSYLGGGNMSTGSIDDLEALTALYRRSYRQMSVRFLLPQAVSHLESAIQALKTAQSASASSRLLSIVAQASMLVGTLFLHDLGDLVTAESYYAMSHRAILKLGDSKLEAYLLGAMSFLSSYKGKRKEAVAFTDRAREIAEKHASSWTQAWLYAVSAEMLATDGLEQQSLNLLDAAEKIMDEGACSPTWIGIGSFDRAKLDAYRGACSVRLHRPKEAHAFLLTSLRDLDSGCLKHRCTAQADLAAAMIAMNEIESGAHLAIDVLDAASQTGHVMTMRRVATLTDSLVRLQRSPKIVGELQGRLQNLTSYAIS